MSDEVLVMALSANERTLPLIQGRYLPQDPRIIAKQVHPAEMFYRQLKFAEYDLSEMSMSSLLISRSKGDERFLALPIFTMRMFFHTTILVRKDSGISSPQDLKGKRIGVPEYQQTWAVWSRGVLQQEFGVMAQDIEWHMERTPDLSHGGSTGFTAPDGVVVKQIPKSTSIGEMLMSGGLDGTLIYLWEKNLLDRSTADISEVCKPLFAKPEIESTRFYKKTGLYPINHAVVIRKDVYERHPDLATQVLDAFEKARQECDDVTRKTLVDYASCGFIDPDVLERIGRHPRSYGIAGSRDVLETICRYVHEQGLVDRCMALEEIFAPSIMES